MPASATQTKPHGGAEPLQKQDCAEMLAEARERTLALVADVAEEDMNRVHDPLMSPLVWDLGHIGAFEDLWLCQRAAGMEPLRPDLAQVYDAFETPRSDRGELPYLRLGEALDYLTEVRERALAALDSADFGDASDQLNHEAFVWQMLIQHEHQHNETMLQTLMLAAPGTYSPRARELPIPDQGTHAPDAMIRIAGGPFVMGVDRSAGFTYDNERPAHEVYVPPFEIDRLPVTNGRFAEFVADGGYVREELWSPEGRGWLARERAAGREVRGPLYWTGDGRERRFDRVDPLDPGKPVMYVSWFEADAFARWAGRRLPTEAEWEMAASWDPANRSKNAFPWGDEAPDSGRANLDHLAFGPAAAGAHPAGASAYGVLGMIGDAWEWTASSFGGYPGFEAFPYPEYSEVFFGDDYRVLRGGSWATRPPVVRNSFRNWDYPERRQIHAGFRCARNA